MVLIDGKWQVAPIQLNGLILVPIMVILFLIPVINQAIKKQINWKKNIIWGLFLIYIWFLLTLTIFPIPIFDKTSEVYKMGFGKQIFINCKLSVLETYMPLQLIGNIVLFAPLSFFAAIYNSKFAKWYINIFIVFLGSLTIETLQLIMSYFYLGNRIFDVNDLLLNTLGGLLGLVFFKLLNAFFRKEISIVQD